MGDEEFNEDEFDWVAAERLLIRWAGLVGYTRVWLPDRVVEPTSASARPEAARRSR